MSDKIRRKLDLYEFLLDFIAHEIRNPLNSIILFGNLMTEGSYGEMSPKQQEILGRILASAYRIEHMTGDFLHLRQFESGEEIVHREWLHVGEDVVEVTLKDLASKFPEHAAHLAAVRREDCGTVKKIFADRQLMLTIYDNLFFNALKYGKKNGKISWGCGMQGRFWEMTVTNEGQGVRREALADVFKKFYRVQDKNLPRQPGTGLGLFNVQRIVRLHKGKIRAESRYGKDFTIRFTIPRPEEK